MTLCSRVHPYAYGNTVTKLTPEEYALRANDTVNLPDRGVMRTSIGIISDTYRLKCKTFETKFPRIEMGFRLPLEILAKYPDGILHFYEHLIFLRHKEYSSTELAAEFSKIGADVNAYTNSDRIAINVRGHMNDTLKLLSLMREMLWCQLDVIDTEIFENERAVVLEEANLRVSRNFTTLYDTIGEITTAGHLNSIGLAEQIQLITWEDIVNLTHDVYAHGKHFISVVGTTHAKKAAKIFVYCDALSLLDHPIFKEDVVTNETTDTFYMYHKDNMQINYLSQSIKVNGATKFIAPLKQTVIPLMQENVPFELINHAFITKPSEIFRKSYDPASNTIEMLKTGDIENFTVSSVFFINFKNENNEGLSQRKAYDANLLDTVNIRPLDEYLCGMDGILFDEIRNKLGLAYSVGVYITDIGNYHAIIMYAETSAHENIKTILDTFKTISAELFDYYTEDIHAIMSRKVLLRTERQKESIGFSCGKLEQELFCVPAWSEAASTRDELKVAWDTMVVNNPNTYNFVVGQRKGGE